MSTTIQLKRTNRSYDTPDLQSFSDISQAEPLYVKGSDMLYVSHEDSAQFKDMKGVKLVNSKLIDCGIFYKETEARKYLVNNKGENIAVEGVSTPISDINVYGTVKHAIVENIKIPVSSWVDDDTYSAEGYNYKAEINIEGCTKYHKATTTFSLHDWVTGNFSPISGTAEDTVIVWAKEKPASETTVLDVELVAGANDPQPLPLKNLLNTSWKFGGDGSVVFPSTPQIYNVNFSFRDPSGQMVYCKRLYIYPNGESSTNAKIIYQMQDGTLIPVYLSNNTWDTSKGEVRFITFDGGDTLNADLSSWVFDNAEQLTELNVGLTSFKPATSTEAGQKGLVPAPPKGAVDRFLNCDGNWKPVMTNVFEAGSQPPENTKLLWIDTTPVVGGLKYYDGNAWIAVPVQYTE